MKSPTRSLAQRGRVAAEALETARSLSGYRNGCAAMSVGSLSSRRLGQAATQGLVERSDDKDSMGGRIWRLTLVGRERLEEARAADYSDGQPKVAGSNPAVQSFRD